MAATLYGPSTLGFGCTNESTSNGYYIADLSVDASSEEAFVPNHKGEDISVVLYNEQATLTGNGVVVTANDPFHTLSGILSVAGSALYGSTKLGGGTAFSKFYITGLSLRNSNKDFQQGSFTAISRFGITDALGTSV